MSNPAENLVPFPSQPAVTPAPAGTQVRLPPEQIKPNPHFDRGPLDEDEEEALVGLMGSIQQDELLQNPTVRLLPDGTYELITGSLRVEAFRRLRDQATTEEERQRYATIPVEVKTGVDDLKMASRPIAENAHRVELTPVKMARAVVALMEKFGLSHEQVKQETGLQDGRIERLVRLHAVADFIKQACKGSRQGRGGRPGLDMMSAIELDKAYAHLLEREAPDIARQRVEPLVQKAIAEEWSFRELQKQLKRLMGGSQEQVGEDSPDASASGADFEAPGSEGLPATAPIAAPAEPSPALTRMEPGSALKDPAPHPLAKSDNPALEYVGGDPNAVCVHLDRFEQLTGPQCREVREILEILLSLVPQR